MAIATISGDTGSVHNLLEEADFARTGESGARSTGLALITGKPLRPGPHGAVWQGAPLASAPFYRAMPTSTAFAPRPETMAPALRGYALSAPTRSPPSSAARTSGATSKTATSKSTSKTTARTSSTATARELAFLDDKHLSIEDKLFQFMMLMTKKSDQELIDAMKVYEGKKTAAQSKTSSPDKASNSSDVRPASQPQHESSGGGLFGFLGDALGGIGKTLVGGAESLVKDLGGPLLAGVATAVGLPFLAPLALQMGGSVGAGIIEIVASSVGLGTGSASAGGAASKSASSASRSPASASKSASAASSKSTSSVKSSTGSSAKSSAVATDGEFDEKLEMFKLQRLVEKQGAMFSALTNAMKSMHDSQMTAVQNIR
jgi:hypothetical protein